MWDTVLHWDSTGELRVKVALRGRESESSRIETSQVGDTHTQHPL